jgi:hypothetical protein
MRPRDCESPGVELGTARDMNAIAKLTSMAGELDPPYK